MGITVRALIASGGSRQDKSVFAFMMVLTGDHDGIAWRACDVEVHWLLTTRDPVELQRAGLLVRELRCDVARRWMPPADGIAS